MKPEEFDASTKIQNNNDNKGKNKTVSLSRNLTKDLVLWHDYSTSRDGLDDLALKGRNRITLTKHTIDPQRPPIVHDGYVDFDINSRNYLYSTASSEVLSITDQFTMACWFKETPFSGSSSTTLNQGLISGGGMGIYIGKAINQIGRRVFGYGHIGFQNVSFATYDIPEVDDQWHFCGFSYKSNSVRMNWYDKHIHISDNFISGNVTLPTQGLTVGVIDITRGTSGNYFNGKIAQCYIWNRSLSPLEILEMYSSTKPVIDSLNV